MFARISDTTSYTVLEKTLKAMGQPTQQQWEEECNVAVLYRAIGSTISHKLKGFHFRTNVGSLSCADVSRGFTLDGHIRSACVRLIVSANVHFPTYHGLGSPHQSDTEFAQLSSP
jgi:hypothetical protein